MSQQYVFKSPFRRTVAGVVDRLGRCFVSPFLRQPASSLPQRVLLVRLDHLGDVVCILPLVQRIASLRPKPYLAVCVSSAGAQILRDTPGIDDIIVFDAPWFARKYSGSQTPGSIRKLLKTLRAGRFDTVLELRGDLRHHVLLFLAGIPRRVGYGMTAGGFLLHETLPWDPHQHPIDLNLAFLKVFGVQPPSGEPARLIWKMRPDEERWLAQKFPGTGYWLFHMDAGTPAKRWPLDRFAELIQRAKRKGMDPVLVGSDPSFVPADSPAVNLLGQTSLPQLIGLISRAAGMVSTDSGPAHIAAALGRPTRIVWSGTSDPAVWKPRGPHVLHAQVHVPCEYCGEERCPLPEQICMTRLSVDQVASMVELDELTREWK